MPKTKRLPDPLAPVPHEDLAARVRLLRREVVVRENQAIPVDPEDPDSPVELGRRVRVAWVPQVLHEQGSITKPMFEAACRYRDDYELGFMPATPTRMPVQAGRGGGGYLTYSERRITARRAFIRAKRALGEGLADIAEACVLHNASLRAYASTRLQPDGKSTWNVANASGYLRAALELLEQHYRPPQPAATN